jgi:NTP pyrophosphatase (non-canonical NTP hydrolase)
MTPEETLRPSVRWFAERMERELRANAYKGGWAGCDAPWLLKRLREETRELAEAIRGGDAEDIAAEAADVANFAMMIADPLRTGEFRR